MVGGFEAPVAEKTAFCIKFHVWAVIWLVEPVVNPIEFGPSVIEFVTVRFEVVMLDVVMLAPVLLLLPPPLPPRPVTVPVTVIFEKVALHAVRLLVEKFWVV